MIIDHKPDSGIALVRAEYLFPYIELLRGSGAPIDRELGRARLPALIEELPEAYVCTDLVFRFVEGATRKAGIEDIGFEAGWRLTYDDLGPALGRTLQQAPTLRFALETFSRLASLEDSEYRCELWDQGKNTRICIRQYVPKGSDTRIAEWQNIKAIVEVIRQFQRPDWLPPTIGLMSPRAITAAQRDRLGDIRVLTRQPETFIEIPAQLLAETRPLSQDTGARDSLKKPGCSCVSDLARFDDDLMSRLRTALIPYLSSGQPGIELAADIAGTSVRNLQRRLEREQTSYSALLESVRFRQALHLLRHTDMKILDIALSLGYSDASNFARTMRRMSGFSPRELRLPVNHPSH